MHMPRNQAQGHEPTQDQDPHIVDRKHSDGKLSLSHPDTGREHIVSVRDACQAPTLKAENERLTDRLEWMTSAALDLVKVLERAGMTDEMEKEIAAIRDLATLTK
jgi:hypothetical protein